MLETATEVRPNASSTTPGGEVNDFVTKTLLVSSTNHRPLHDLCMCTEAVRVGQLMHCLKCLRCIPLELKTDRVLYRRTNRAKHSLAELN